jgi:hypothetical protein
MYGFGRVVLDRNDNTLTLLIQPAIRIQDGANVCQVPHGKTLASKRFEPE